MWNTTLHPVCYLKSVQIRDLHSFDLGHVSNHSAIAQNTLVILYKTAQSTKKLQQ